MVVTVTKTVEAGTKGEILMVLSNSTIPDTARLVSYDWGFEADEGYNVGSLYRELKFEWEVDI